MLGDVVPIMLDDLNCAGSDTTLAYYLEVSLNGDVITSRTRLVPAPHAHISERMLGDFETSASGCMLTSGSMYVASTRGICLQTKRSQK